MIVAEVRSSRDLPDPNTVAQAIRAQCNVSPHTIVFVSSRAIARTTSGKISRSLTRQRWLRGALPAIATHVVRHGELCAKGIEGLRRRLDRLVEGVELSGRSDAVLGDLGLELAPLLWRLLLEFREARWKTRVSPISSRR